MEKLQQDNWDRLEKYFENLKTDLSNQIKTSQQTNQPSLSSDKHAGHKNIEEMVGCTNCWPKIKPLAEAKLKSETHPPKKAYHCATCNNEVDLKQEICGLNGCQGTETREKTRIE